MKGVQQFGRWGFGIVLILVVAAIWAGSSVLTQYMYNDLDFKSPFFITYFSTTLFALYLPVWYISVYLGYTKDLKWYLSIYLFVSVFSPQCSSYRFQQGQVGHKLPEESNLTSGFQPVHLRVLTAEHPQLRWGYDEGSVVRGGGQPTGGGAIHAPRDHQYCTDDEPAVVLRQLLIQLLSAEDICREQHDH